MPLTAGTLSVVSRQDTKASLLATAATDGTTPYSYQWYRSTATGFSPGVGNAVSGATSLTLNDTGLTPGTIYYYKVVVIDSAGTPASASYAQVSLTTLQQTLSQNAFTEGPYLGMVDQRFNYNTLTVQFDPAGTGTLVAGQAVKWSTTAGGVPMVVPSLAVADVVAGFVNYNMKNPEYVPGDFLEISQAGNVIYLWAAAAINRGQQVSNLPAAVAGGCNGGVSPVSTGLPIVGFALDTKAIGNLVRIEMRTPSNTLAS